MISDNLLDIFENKINSHENSFTAEVIINCIKESFLAMEKLLFKLAEIEVKNNQIKFAYIGSCALFSLVLNNKIYVANLGDSQGIIFGNLKRKK